MKGVDTLIASVLILIIFISAVFITLQLSEPSIQKSKEILLIQEGKSNLINIENAVKEVLAEGEGSVRVLKFTTSGGYYKIDNSSNSIVFSMDSFSQIIAEGVSKIENNINITSKTGKIYLNLSYENIEIIGWGEFGRGYHSLTIRNNGFNETSQKQMIYISLIAPTPPTIITFTEQYNQTQTFVLKGTSLSNPSNLNDLGINTYNIIEALEFGGQYDYFQENTINITGFNTTSPNYLNNLDSQNYNVTSRVLETLQENNYNQSGQPYIAFGGNPSGNYINLNVLGEGLTYDIPESQSGIQETKLWNVTPSFADRQSVDVSYGSCTAGSLDTNNNVYCGNTLSIDANEWGWVNSTHSSNIPSDATITNVTICWNGYFDTRTNDNANDRSYVIVGENSTGSWIYTTVYSCIGTACNFYTDTTRCYDVTSIINNVNKAKNVRISLYHFEADDGAQDIFDDYNYVNITYTRPLYKVEVWHNSSQITYSGSLNSINVTINFSATQSKTYTLQIYNWVSSSWTDCYSSLVTTNSWNMWWCNITFNPQNYISNGIARIRIFSNANEVQGILREDYVRYYVSFTLYGDYNVLVEHNSSEVYQPKDLISNINITSVLKANTTTTAKFYAYNFSGNNWYTCKQTSIGTSYSKVECIINDPNNFIGQENKISLRLEFFNSVPFQIMEDYLIYQINVPKNYRAEVEHNSTVSYSGTLNSINVSLNFSTNLTSSFDFLIYNFNLNNWENCYSFNAIENNWYMIWCNKTINPEQYLYNNIISVRLNETYHESLAEIKEDYIQYYVTYTQ